MDKAKENDAVLKQISELIESGKFNQSQVARSIGHSPTTLSQVLAKKYPGKTGPVIKALESFLQDQHDRESLSTIQVSFLESNYTKRIMEGAKICSQDNEIGVCVGNAGMQKSYSVSEYAKRNPNCILIEVDPSTTAKSLFRDLIKKTGGSEQTTNLHDMFEEVVSKLKGTGRLIICDEAENLGYRSLELLRRVYDKAGVGLYLVGMPRLISNLRGKKGEYAQLYSRVSLVVNLNNYATKLLTEDPQTLADDAKNFIEHLIPGCNGHWSSIYNKVGFNARVILKLSRRINRLAANNSGKVTNDIVERAFTMIII